MNYKSIFTIGICLLAGLISQGQTQFFIDTASTFGYEWKSLNIGFPTENDLDNVTLPDTIIQIDSISESQFLQFSKNYSSKIIMDTSVIYKTDSSFTIANKNFQATFDAYRICECSASTYLGLISPLNLYLINTVDMHNEVAYSNLIDSKTGKSFDVPSCSDPGPHEILISPQNEFLLTYDNSYYEHDNCCIYILKAEKRNELHSYTLNNYMNINIDRLNITQLVWVNENCFVMSVTEQTDPEIFDETKKLKYFLKITMQK